MKQYGIVGALLCLWAAPVWAAGSAELLWELTGLSAPESVLYDADTQILYVSSMDGGGYDKDGNGFISKVNMEGGMVQREWVTGLDAPRGMGLVGGKLYVSDIDRLLEIDVNSGTVLHSYAAAGAVFLNDVAVTASGDVYVSDTETNVIHRLRAQSLEPWLEGEALDHPNGLLANAGRMIIASWGTWMDPDAPAPHLGRLLYVPLADTPGAPQDLMGPQPMGNLDGVEAMGDGSWLVSDWVAGKVYRVREDGSRHVLVDAGQGTADIEYIPALRLLLVPLMKQDALVAYRLQKTFD